MMVLNRKCSETITEENVIGFLYNFIVFNMPLKNYLKVLNSF